MPGFINSSYKNYGTGDFQIYKQNNAINISFFNLLICFHKKYLYDVKNVDYIIIGLGIGGLAFAETLRNNNKSFVVFDNNLKGATTASGGVLNPTVLKRFTAAWNIEAFADYAIPFYENLGEKLQSEILTPVKIYRILNSVEEQNDWIVASGKNRMQPYLQSDLLKNNNGAINAPFKLGKVNKGYQLHPKKLISEYRLLLKQNNYLISEEFQSEFINIKGGTVAYKNYKARHIVFAEGAKVVKNPFFTLAVSPNVPKHFVGNKGEYIIIKAPELKINVVLKGSLMIIPLGGDLYKVGASYSRDDFSIDPTKEACEDISVKLKKMINCDFKVVDQVAGIRPTVKDRKPLIGSLNDGQNIYFLNGLGTRGLTMAPLLAKHLFDFIEEEKSLPKEVDIKRFV